MQERYLFISQFGRRGWYDVNLEENGHPPATIEYSGVTYLLRQLQVGDESMAVYASEKVCQKGIILRLLSVGYGATDK